MYLHIGNGQSIKLKSIIGIYDLDSSTVSSVTKRFINKKQKEKCIEYTDSDLPRSFILTDSGKVYLSRISVQGLKARAYGGYEQEEIN